MLTLKQVGVSYGHVNAVRGISLDIAAGEAVALLGPNGAGKSSTLAAITGLVQSQGEILLEGKDLRAVATEDRIRAGMALVPEGRRIFANLTVVENLRLGGAILPDKGAVAAGLDEMLTFFPRLAERRTQIAGTLSGGEQQMLALARALMAKPRLVLLDEPSLGLAPRIVSQIFEFIAAMKSRGMTLLIVEQNAAQALRVADRAYIMSTGKVTLSGKAADLVDDPSLVSAYLGS